MTTIRTFADPLYASIIASFLTDGGIEAVLLDENVSSYSSASLNFPVRLQVRDDQVEEAVSLLHKFEDKNS